MRNPKIKSLLVAYYLFGCILLFVSNGFSQIDQLLTNFNQKAIANYKSAYEEFGGKVYMPIAIVPEMTKEKAMKIIKVELDKWIYPVPAPGHTEPAYFNDSTYFISNRIKKPILVTEDYIQFGTSSSDTVTIKYCDILFDEMVLKTPFKDKVTCRFTVNKHNFRSCHDEFADALYYMRYKYSIKYFNQQIENFKAMAKSYIKLTEKPQISEEQRKYFIQANAMNETRQYKNAIKLYNVAMTINPISYPSGYFNLALIASLDENFPYAVCCMKKYLMLLPDAEDKRDAQDKIYQWEAFIK